MQPVAREPDLTPSQYAVVTEQIHALANIVNLHNSTMQRQIEDVREAVGHVRDDQRRIQTVLDQLAVQRRGMTWPQITFTIGSTIAGSVALVVAMSLGGFTCTGFSAGQTTPAHLDAYKQVLSEQRRQGTANAPAPPMLLESLGLPGDAELVEP